MRQKRKFTDQQFLELYNQDLNDRQMAEKLKVSIVFIKKTRYKLGLMPKNQYINSNPKSSYKKLKEAENRSYKLRNEKPDRKAAIRAYSKAYNMRPEVKAKRKARDQAINQKPEVKARRRARSKIREQKPERKAWKKAYNKAYDMRPEVKARRKAHNQAIAKLRKEKLKEKSNHVKTNEI